MWGHAYGLLLLGAAAAIAFLCELVLKQLGWATRLNAPLTGAMALSSFAAGAYYLATGHFGPTAFIIWLANWLFAGQPNSFRSTSNSFRARQRPGKTFTREKASFFTKPLPASSGIDLASRMAPGLILMAFGPLFTQGFSWFLASPVFQVHRLGINEMLYAIAFGMIFIAGFHFPIG